MLIRMYIFNNNLVILFVLQIVTFLTLISAENNTLISPPVSSKENATNKVTTANNVTHETPAANKIKGVVTESGGAIKIQVTPSVNISQSHNREHVIDEPYINNASILASSVPPTSSTSLSSSSTSTTTVRNIPINEEKSIMINKTEHSDHKKISARKGVNFSDDVEQPKLKVKKPLITVASDEPFAPSHFQSKSNSSASLNMPKVPNLDMISENNQGNTQKYVVPIVIVILSVPFVAILISVLYKRGSEWWKYRHYRRMDFLINGMYDN